MGHPIPRASNSHSLRVEQRQRSLHQRDSGMGECSDILKVMTMRLEAFGGSPGVLEKLIRREDLSGKEATAALLRSLGFER